MLVIEDAHWADESTRDLLYFLIDNQDAMPGVLIIVTYRSCELRRGHPFCALLPRLSRLGWVQRAELPGLGREESAELVGHLLGGAPGLPLADRVYRRAEGIPLLIEELVGAGRARGLAGTATTSDLMLAADPRAARTDPGRAAHGEHRRPAHRAQTARGGDRAERRRARGQRAAGRGQRGAGRPTSTPSRSGTP